MIDPLTLQTSEEAFRNGVIVAVAPSACGAEHPQNYLDRRRNFTRQQFWARGYHDSTVDRDEYAVREYIIKALGLNTRKTNNAIYMFYLLEIDPHGYQDTIFNL